MIQPNNECLEKTIDQELIQLLLTLLCSPKIPPELTIEQTLADDPEFQKLYRHILDLRELSMALSKGDTQLFVEGNGFILANLKSLQSNLRRLIWQTQRVAKGNFSSKVDFLGEFSGTFNDMIWNLKNANAQLYKLASLDCLTQLYNRRVLDQFLKEAYLRARERGSNLSILMIDIDHFKNVNDQYGHHAGDQVLIQISRVLKEQFRATDMLARYGGEEFMAIQPETSTNQAIKIANRVLEAVRGTVIRLDIEHRLMVTVSVGISSVTLEDQSFEDVVKRSDAALYEAKHNGRDCLYVL
ncbi:GGDEF domain-containing protein [Anaerospora hongkongensis]|uniref:GGDEF domain-containing protein n=1 Tax=Anaerospora hongkongensis TaxID=244830 RepID=UPI0028A19A12|nr:GGDEF domain-containing protein [Anaerospora hongkongensis]